MYVELTKLIKTLGKELRLNAGRLSDIGETKKWLTKKDLEIEKRLTKYITSLPGKHTVYAEELSNSFEQEENVWIIDPISYTFHFLHGIPHYAIVIGHMHTGKMEFGCVYDPSVDELFSAKKSKGAYLNGKRIHVDESDSDIAIMYDPHTRSRKKLKLDLLSDLMNIGRVTMLGSTAVHYCSVACGRVQAAVALNHDVFPEFASKLIIEEAGGIFTDTDGGQLLLKTKGIIASNKMLYEKILSVTSKYGINTT